MPEAADLQAVEAELTSNGRSHSDFYVPIVRAIVELGGRARKSAVVAKARELLEGILTRGQLDYLERNGRFGWARRDLRAAGLVDGERGYWQLTPLGRLYAEVHASDPLEISVDIPESAEPARSTAQTESVPASSTRAYEVPLLEVLASGASNKSEILSQLGERIGLQLLPGDERLNPSGMKLWIFRASWALSNLGKAGYAENPSLGQWGITDAGRERLRLEREAWRIDAFGASTAKVRVEGDAPPRATAAPTDAWDEQAWLRLRTRISKSVLDALARRLRPDLGASPDIAVPRNVILYGPPGTGKTFVATQVARALVGSESEERLSIVQFHPSYAYEDFVQGLRPDLKQTQLRYELHKGPFLRMAEAAAQQPDELFVLVIDEINRGDPARIFGELLYALEYRNEAVDLALGGELVVPPNLFVIGTMNSVDRSVALVDYALRRRFGFIRVDPSPEVVSAVRREGLLREIGPYVLERFNHWLVARLGREYALGHSFFISPSVPDEADDAFERIWRNDVYPLLEEYFFGDEDGLKEAGSVWYELVDTERKRLRTVQSEAEADEQAESDAD